MPKEDQSYRVSKRSPQRPERKSARLAAKHSPIALTIADIGTEKKSHLPSPTSDPLVRQGPSKASASYCGIERPASTGHSPFSEIELPSAQLTHDNHIPVSPLPQKVQQEGFPSQKRRWSHTADNVESATKRLRSSPTPLEHSVPTPTKKQPIHHWIEHGRWPKRFFDCNTLSQQNQENNQYFEEKRGEDWYKEAFRAELEERDGIFPSNNMSHLLARRRSRSTLGRQNSEPSLVTPSDQKPREIKSTDYNTAQYEILLETKGIFMRESDLNISEASRDLCRILLEKSQMIPSETLFHEDCFDRALQNLQSRNEAMVIRDIGTLIVPPAQTFATRGASRLRILTETVNEGWNCSIPVTKTRPQPDYSVGFGRSAFTRAQLERLKPFTGDIDDAFFTYFAPTYRMFFPFLTSEVKCGSSALDIADRQNAHSMTIAVRAVAELYKNAQWEEGFDWKQEIHREILAFSISHDHNSVRIYGHYPVLNGDDITYFRHTIKTFILPSDNGKEKWTAYRFVKNVYDLWMPKHLEKIQRAIDNLPTDLNFEVSSLLSFDSVVPPGGDLEQSDSQESRTSASTAGFKKPRLKPTVMLQQQNSNLQQEKEELRDEVKALNLRQQEQWEKIERQRKEEREELERQRKEEREELERQRKEEREQMDRQWKEEREEMKQQIRDLMALLKKS